jgi:hypothetical protein
MADISVRGARSTRRVSRSRFGWELSARLPATDARSPRAERGAIAPTARSRSDVPQRRGFRMSRTRARSRVRVADCAEPDDMPLSALPATLLTNRFESGARGNADLTLATVANERRTRQLASPLQSRVTGAMTTWTTTRRLPGRSGSEGPICARRISPFTGRPGRGLPSADEVNDADREQRSPGDQRTPIRNPRLVARGIPAVRDPQGSRRRRRPGRPTRAREDHEKPR